MKTDIENSTAGKLLPIKELRHPAIQEDDLELYGKYGKTVRRNLTKIEGNPEETNSGYGNQSNSGRGRLKQQQVIGLAQAFAKLDKKAMLALREPSLGPVSALSGAAGGAMHRLFRWKN